MDAPKFAKVCQKCRKAKEWHQFIRAQDITGIICTACFRKAQKGLDTKNKTYDSQAALDAIKALATGSDDAK